MTPSPIRIVAAFLGAFGMISCSSVPPAPSLGAKPAGARAVNLVAGDGSGRGKITMRGAPGSSALIVQAVGLAPGIHGLHLHEKGLCEGPDFASAGGHWNPAARKHGRDNPAGAHLGDLPNLAIDASGKGRASLTLPPGSADADGTSLVVHAQADDYRTDPSGNSGNRIACAVIAAPR
jgi:Cu-Zn family superoxide dismutase